MRAIEFRGKCIKTGKWVYGGFHKHQNRTPCPIGDNITDKDFDYLIIQSGFSDWNMPKPIELFAVDPSTVGQYSRQKDKKGKKIYEGDFIEGGYMNPLTGEYEKRIYLVEVTDMGYRGKLIGHSPYGDTFLSWIGNHEKFNREIIGNKYDNPELLEVQQSP